MFSTTADDGSTSDSNKVIPFINFILFIIFLLFIHYFSSFVITETCHHSEQSVSTLCLPSFVK